MSGSMAQVDDTVPAELAPMFRYMFGIIAAALLIAPALFFGARISWSDIMLIKRVRVTSNFEYLHPTELEEKVANMIRGGFFTVNVASIKRELLREEWINRVVVKRGWPDSLMLHITEHKPVAIWGRDALLSSEMAVFSPPPDSFPPGLPVLTGPRGSHEMVWERYAFIMAELASRNLEVAALELTERRAWQFQLADGPLVMLGKKNVVERLNRFFRFVLPHHVDDLSGAISIDMRYTNGFAIKWPTVAGGGA